MELTFREGGEYLARVGKGGNRDKAKKKKREDSKTEPPPSTPSNKQSASIPVVHENASLIRFDSGGRGSLTSTDENALTREAKELGITIAKVLAHIFVVLLLIVLGVVGHYLIKDKLGDPLVADSIPVRYALELGDVAIIFSLVVKLIWDILTGNKNTR